MAISFKDFNKQINEEQLDEISKSTAKSYVDKKMDKIYSADKAPGKEKAKKDIESLQRAHERIVGNKPTSEEVEIEEANSGDDEHFSKQSPKMQDAINRHLRSGKSYKDAVTSAQKHVKEELKGNQHKLDVDHDGKIERSDLKKLRSKKDEIVVNKGQTVRENDNCGKKMYREFVEEIQEIVAEAKKDDYWDFKDLKAKEKNQPTSRKVAGTRYGGSAQKDEPEDDDNDDKPAVKRGRGRPAGSKSGARQKGNGNNYGGLAIHSLNLPSKK